MQNIGYMLQSLVNSTNCVDPILIILHIIDIVPLLNNGTNIVLASRLMNANIITILCQYFAKIMSALYEHCVQQRS